MTPPRPLRQLPTQQRLGFTLIELMVCVAVLALLAAVATPSLAALLQRHRALAAEHTLISHLHLARVSAVTRRKPAVLCPSLDGRHCSGASDWSVGWLVFMDHEGRRTPRAPEDIVRGDTQPTSPKLKLTSTRGRSHIRYLPDGRSSGTNLTFSICSRNDEMLAQVIVNNAGRVRSQQPSAPRACVE